MRRTAPTLLSGPENGCCGPALPGVLRRRRHLARNQNLGDFVFGVAESAQPFALGVKWTGHRGLPSFAW